MFLISFESETLKEGDLFCIEASTKSLLPEYLIRILGRVKVNKLKIFLQRVRLLSYDVLHERQQECLQPALHLRNTLSVTLF